MGHHGTRVVVEQDNNCQPYLFAFAHGAYLAGAGLVVDRGRSTTGQLDWMRQWLSSSRTGPRLDGCRAAG
jgi:hypothetical protein